MATTDRMRIPGRAPLIALGTCLLLAAVVLAAGGPERPYAAQARAVAPHLDPALVAPLLETVDREGTDAALARLEREAAAPVVARQTHDLAHAIGMYAYASAGPAAARGRCARDFNFGCIHGMVEAHVLALPGTPAPDRAALGRVCGEVFRYDGRDAAEIGTCWHGIGHALAMRALPRQSETGEIFSVLEHCELLDPRDARRLCAAGVFMERIGVATGMSDGRAGSRKSYLDERPGQLLWPCDDARTREDHRAPCYAMQGMGLLDQFEGRVSAAAAVCAMTGPYAADCHRGIGFALFVRYPLTLEGPDALVRRCDAAGAGREDCVIGVVSDLGFPQDRILGHCRAMTRDRTAERCVYEAARHILYAVSDPRERRAACEGAPAAFRPRCREVAGAAE